MFRAILLLVTLLAALSQCSLEAAFAHDGYTIHQQVAHGDGVGIVAYANNATNMRTGRPKKAFYLKGTGYEMGYMTSVLATEDVHTVCTVFLDVIPLALVAPGFVRKHNNSIVLKEVEELIKFLLVDAGVAMFHKENARGIFNKEILGEMQGLADGLHSQGITKCSVKEFIALSYSFDLITADAFSGKLWSVLLDRARQQRMSAVTLSVLENREDFVGPLPSCDFIGVRGEFVKTAGTAYFGRAYQFQQANILQDLNSVAVMTPSPASAWKNQIVSVFSPGFVGSFAGMNTHSLAMGVDTIRSPNANQSHVGLNSLLMIRSVLHQTVDLQSAVAFITESPRGAPFLYPVCDKGGDCAVLESGNSLPPGVPENPLQYVSNKLIKKHLVPNSAFLASHPTSTFERGLYVRRIDYEYPVADGWLDYNKALFAYHNYPYNPEAFKDGTKVFLFNNWTADNKAAGILGNDFFMPQLESEKDMFLGTNYAIVPQMRMTMMNAIDDYFAKITAEAPLWRYNKLLSLVLEKKGEIDFETAIWLMTFLGPDREPGYWHTFVPGVPSPIIEGSISIYDLSNCVVVAKSGYWGGPTQQISLLNYRE